MVEANRLENAAFFYRNTLAKAGAWHSEQKGRRQGLFDEYVSSGQAAAYAVAFRKKHQVAGFIGLARGLEAGLRKREPAVDADSPFLTDVQYPARGRYGVRLIF
ncbi:hypothetical protein EJD96_11255 [Herbaspirillum seropedicae]|uniref:hypothetical protein n=1 Tax=Herbaspirillum seropedicae TaxID=964 RepID=UPI00111E35D2|nr:hypothetical protein [Herbaspirillum seropedicae]QDD64701.1 hypothetical protein EJD96_11255 [Herbaspirillum seropedicae]